MDIISFLSLSKFKLCWRYQIISRFNFIFTKKYRKLISREITQNRELCTYCFLLDMLNDFIKDYTQINWFFKALIKN
jgi:hypothetical protein